MSLSHVLAVMALVAFAVSLTAYQFQQVAQYDVGASSARTVRLVLATGAIASLISIPPLWNIVT